MVIKNQPGKFGILLIKLIPLILVFLVSACSGTPPVVTVATINQPAAEVIPSSTPFAPAKLPEATVVPSPADAHQIPDPSKYQWVTAFSGFTQPVDLVSPPGDPAKIIVVEQPGVIRMIQEGTLSTIPFLDIRERIGNSGSEQGLLGIAFHPLYLRNRFFFVNYTDLNGNTVIARFTATQNGESADPASEKKLIQVNQPYPNHNGGGLAFGRDGYLYIGLGDGGSAGDPQNNAQNLNTLLGKLLRIDVSQPDGYSIPADNPYINSGGKPEIWAYGLRNPWRFSFDTGTGDLYIGDVGQNLWEEVDYLPAGSAGGANFGWSLMEGNHPYRPQGDVPGNLVYPISEYDHNSGCSITGGYVYRGYAMPEWQGVYLFGDYCRGTVWGLIKTTTGVEVKNVSKINGNISSFGVDGAGEIYALEHHAGAIFKLVPR
jgi:glucose/arabinose dehydrogenase